ncbi:MAG: phosphate ABC transporter permease subunit PstC [Alphaproteobacteria bacterium GM7ARS4]|nr:phosphate ABC transporter permease subunit PstC [Alphaproteobacteria bacterium GM7ARS4]
MALFLVLIVIGVSVSSYIYGRRHLFDIEAYPYIPRHASWLMPLFSSFVLTLCILFLLSVFEEAHLVLSLVLLAFIAVACFLIGHYDMARPSSAVRRVMGHGITIVLLLCTCVSVLTAFAIMLSLLIESLRFFLHIHPLDVFFGTTWSPQFSTTDSNNHGAFGFLPLLWGTFYISFIAVLFASSIGFMTAIYLNQYASRAIRMVVKPLLEILAGIPTVVYGFFAITLVGPFLNQAGHAIGVNIATTSVLTAGIVMGIMLIPFISSLSEDVMHAVPRAMIESSYGIGATKSETIKYVILPAALPGLIGALTLTLSRAVGETMIVVMAAGIAARLTLNPFEPLTTVTVKIVSQLTGDFEFDTPQTLVSFALGMTLFLLTFAMNMVAFSIVRRYQQRYH